MDGFRPSAFVAPSIWKAAVATPKVKSPGKRSAKIFGSIVDNLVLPNMLQSPDGLDQAK
jgi:hypothetical protein